MSGSGGRDEAGRERVPEVARRYSPWLMRHFARWLRGYFARNFDAVRVASDGHAPVDRGGTLLVYANHPSWWDPIHFLLLARHAYPDRRMFGPFDAAALRKYGFFQRLGAFGIDPSTRRGGAEFLVTCRSLLAMPDATLWITAQGRFADPRQRPLELQPGLAHLARGLERGLVVPLAVEYPFWNERRPEALSRFGTPFVVEDAGRLSVEEWTEALTERLAETMDALAASARARDPERFDVIVRGRVGVGGPYDAWRRVKATLRGRRFDPAHQDDRR